MIATVRLQELKTGDLAEITSMVGSEHDLSRLSSLGLRGGARVRMLRSGSTCIVELDETRICVRTGANTQILVQPA